MCVRKSLFCGVVFDFDNVGEDVVGFHNSFVVPVAETDCFIRKYVLLCVSLSLSPPVSPSLLLSRCLGSLPWDKIDFRFVRFALLRPTHQFCQSDDDASVECW